ncbi:unnamed protein product [Heterosigma akashiwo]|mmetsp:Transcript_25416/g.35136  ORF Transcript_25416/g.35136 Transcript_25416/m.35136 type:complete len:245 (-) Transcript_25416:252-986(-)
MGKVFSREKKKNKGHRQADITDQDRAILDLKNARDKLQKYQKKLAIESEELHDKARHLVKLKKQDRALLVLKLKKYKENECSKVDGQLLKIMELIETISWETQQLEVFDALKSGTAALERLNAALPLAEVERLMDDTAEAIAYQDELSALLSGGLALGGAEAEAEVEGELRAFQAALEREQRGAPESAAAPMEENKGSSLEDQMPEAPTHLPQPPATAQMEEHQQRKEKVVAAGEGEERILVPA